MRGLRRRKPRDLRESGALSPNAAVLAEDSGGREMIAINFAHEMFIDIGLPRHPEEKVIEVEW